AESPTDRHVPACYCRFRAPPPWQCVPHTECAVYSPGRDQEINIMTWTDVISLIDRARAGDRTAFGELVERFQPAVYAVALARLRDVNEAVELTQEVFIHALRKLDQLRDPRCFVGWLRQITVRMAINRVTRQAPCKSAEPEVIQN